MRVSWSDFKVNVAAQGFKVRYVATNGVYVLSAYDPGGIICLTCKITAIEAEGVDFEANFQTAWGVPNNAPVQTLREARDLRLQSIAIQGEADVTGLCVATTIVPATGVDLGRMIDWGEAWICGTSHHNDKITVIAVDYESPPGTWTQVSGYTDDDSADAGWWLPEKPAIAEVEPLGYYGPLTGGLRLRIEAQCGGASFTGRWLKVNIAWGKRDA